MAKSNVDYWQERERKATEYELKLDATRINEIERIANMMVVEIEKEINAFINKYAEFEGLSYKEAKKKIDATDISAFTDKVKIYVANKDFSEKANKELKQYNTKMYVSREEMLKRQIAFIIAYATAQTEVSIKKHLESVVYREFERQAGILGDSVLVTQRLVDSIVDMQFLGVKWSERLWTNSKEMRQDVEKIVSNVVLRGRHPNEYVKDMRKHLIDTDKRVKSNTERIKTLLLTESARAQSQAMIESFVEKDEEGKYIYLAKIDERTSKVCKGLHRKVFKVKDAKIGENFPPMHPRCRSSAALYVKSEKKRKKNKYFGGNVSISEDKG
ncbi:minor capsid protein [Staphylococcus felis]|uniref:Minor capsid protein n=1 Tax=Staphylococcus felis TaxID=46127 RepID=A0ABS0QPR0_9STAP|nr:minor capsid protein [Staphylococcus felis]MBH9580887.1 minor capsid protein [Staphylococcus felis]